MVSLCYIYMVSSYVIHKVCYGELVLYIYGELLCNSQTCAMVSSCVSTNLACMQICAKLSSCVIATLARMQICAKLSSCVNAALAGMQTYGMVS